MGVRRSQPPGLMWFGKKDLVLQLQRDKSTTYINHVSTRKMVEKGSFICSNTDTRSDSSFSAAPASISLFNAHAQTVGLIILLL